MRVKASHHRGGDYVDESESCTYVINVLDYVHGVFELTLVALLLPGYGGDIPKCPCFNQKIESILLLIDPFYTKPGKRLHDLL